VKSTFLSVALLMLAGCASTFDRSKVIVEERSDWWGDRYSQGKGRIGVPELMRALESEELARPHAERWRTYDWATMGTFVPGALAMGFGYSEVTRADGNTTAGWTLVCAGAGLFFASQVFADVARSAARDAVAAHNAMIQGTKGSSAAERPQPWPWIGALPDGRGRAAHAAGVAVRF
jgi:hypothetical protein